MPEEQYSIEQTLSEEHCSFEQPQPEEQCSIRVNSLAIPKKNKKKTSNQTAQEEREQVQAKHAIKEQELGGKKREKQLKGSTKKGQYYLLFVFWPHHVACEILVPQPDTEPMTSAVKARSPNHWTREFPPVSSLKTKTKLNQT